MIFFHGISTVDFALGRCARKNPVKKAAKSNLIAILVGQRKIVGISKQKNARRNSSHTHTVSLSRKLSVDFSFLFHNARAIIEIARW